MTIWIWLGLSFVAFFIQGYIIMIRSAEIKKTDGPDDEDTRLFAIAAILSFVWPVVALGLMCLLVYGVFRLIRFAAFGSRGKEKADG